MRSFNRPLQYSNGALGHECKKNLLSRITGLLHSQLFGVLATQGPAYPYCSLVCYAISQDVSRIYFATVRDTRKYRNLAASPGVSLLVNNQTNNVSDFAEAEALTVLGSAAEVDAESRDTARGLFLRGVRCVLSDVPLLRYLAYLLLIYPHEWRLV